MICLGRPYHFKFFKGCLPQILLGPFLNTLTDLFLPHVYPKQKFSTLNKKNELSSESGEIKGHDYFRQEIFT